MSAFFRKLDEGFARFEAAFLALALAVMVLIVFGDFALRATVNQSWTWAKELAAYLMVWVGFVGASLATRRRRHLVMSLSEKLFSPAVRRWTSLLACLITAATCLFLAWLGLRYVMETRATGEASLTVGIPLWLVQAVIPFAFGVVGVRFLGTGMHILRHGPIALGDSGPAPADKGA